MSARTPIQQHIILYVNQLDSLYAFFGRLMVLGVPTAAHDLEWATAATFRLCESEVENGVWLCGRCGGSFSEDRWKFHACGEEVPVLVSVDVMVLRSGPGTPQAPAATLSSCFTALSALKQGASQPAPMGPVWTRGWNILSFYCSTLLVRSARDVEDSESKFQIINEQELLSPMYRRLLAGMQYPRGTL